MPMFVYSNMKVFHQIQAIFAHSKATKFNNDSQYPLRHLNKLLYPVL